MNDKIDDITSERAADYGLPEEQHACTAALLGVVEYFWNRNPRHARVGSSPAARVCLFNLLQKVSRLVCGDVRHLDSWQDIQGYADNGMEVLGVGRYVAEEEAKPTRVCILSPKDEITTLVDRNDVPVAIERETAVKPMPALSHDHATHEGPQS